jgi:hypothetical protein
MVTIPERDLLIDARRYRILSLIEDLIILGNPRFQSKNAKITRF